MKILSLIILLGSIVVGARELPVTNQTVNDYTGLVTPQEKSEIDQEIRSYFDKTTNQLGVLVINSLDGENLEEFSNNVFSQWKLGSAKKDNGVLLVFVIKDRKFRIEVGRGLEGDLTDVESKRIQASIKPYLKNQQYGRAILEEVKLVKSTIDQNNEAYQRQSKNFPTAPVLLNTQSRKQLLDEETLSTIGYFGIFVVLIIFSFQFFSYFRVCNKIKIVKLNTETELLKNQKEIKENEVKTEKLKKELTELKLTYENSDLKVNDSLAQEFYRISDANNYLDSKINQHISMGKKYKVSL